MPILSWNLLRTRGAGVDEIRRLVEAHHPDLVLMQKATALIDALPDRLGGHYLRAPMHRRKHGLAAWSRRCFATKTVALPLATRLDLPVPVFRLVEQRIALIVHFEATELATVHLAYGASDHRPIPVEII